LVNFIGLTNKIIPLMKERGKIIIISSGASKNIHHKNDLINAYSIIKSTLEKYCKIMSDKYYKKNICFCVLQIDDSYDTELTKDMNIQKRDIHELEKCWDYLLGQKWNELTGRIFISSKIINNDFGYNLELNYPYINNTSFNKKILKLDKKYFGQNALGHSDTIAKDQFDNYVSYGGNLHKILAKKYSANDDNIELHNGTLNFLEKIIPFFVKEQHQVICADLIWKVFNNVVHEREIKYGYMKNKNNILVPDYDKIDNDIGSLTRLIYFIAPLERNDFDNFLKKIPKNIVIIIDFCYNEFIDDNNKNIKMSEYINSEYPIICTNTFSKFYGLPGLNLSFSISNKGLTSMINHFFHYPINKITEETAIKALLDINHQTRVKNFYQNEMKKFVLFFDKNKIKYTINNPISITILLNISVNVLKEIENMIIFSKNNDNHQEITIPINIESNNNKIMSTIYNSPYMPHC
jgi:histidinol-phosphate/aromatic aminotransferase/cobyric acid decarboxylase-like protein